MTTTTQTCKFSQVKTECNIIQSKENCHECLEAHIDEANTGSCKCKVCGADRLAYLETMREPCFHRHGEVRQ